MPQFLTNFDYTTPIWIVLVFGILWIGLRWIRSRADYQRSLNMVFLKIFIPKKESRADKEQDTESYSSGQDFREVVGVMSHLFEALYSIYSDDFKSLFTGQDYLSFEYAALSKEFNFYIIVPQNLASLVEKQITAFYPDCFIEIQKDYNIFHEGYHSSTCYLQTTRSEFFPIRTYNELKSDPLNAITNALSKLEKDEGASVQILIRPAVDGWQKKGKGLVQDLMENRTERSLLSYFNPLRILGFFIDAISSSKKENNQDDKKHITPLTEERAKAVESKTNDIGFEAVVRLVTCSKTKTKSREHLANLKSSFQQFNIPHMNSFTTTKRHNERKFLRDFILRSFCQNFWHNLFGKRMIFSPDELASLWHLPSIRYNRSPNIAWQKFKIAPAPDNIPEEGTLLGYNFYRGEKKPIYIKNEDRFRHFYVIGQTGTGKSSILQTMLHQDIRSGKGVCVIDPHGQLIEDILPYIPRERADDVIYFNPADIERPMGLNILEGKDDDERELIALDAMNIMIKLFDEETFGPRIQDYFRNGCLTLMADPDGGALTDIVRLFTDDVFQKYKVSKVKNPVVRSFWENQMAKTGAREQQEMIPYFAAKFGAFVTNSLMRNIVGQVHSAFDFADVMNNRKILLINLSKGLIGDINSKLLGLIIVNKIQVAALRRQRMMSNQRRDFFLYIDEFQNYVTDSIESILSEARKYRLGLVLAHQYLDQLTDERGNEKIKKAIFGNVGTMMAYKIGAQDGEFMAKEMEPVFSEGDLINLDAFKAAIKLSVDNQPSRPFSLDVQKPWDPEWLKKYPKDEEVAEVLKEISRLRYGRDKEFVSNEIERRIGVLK